MSEFSGKKFYGFSLHNDPALSTTTRNFEFRYTRPEQLERAIQKVQLADNSKQRKTFMLTKYCKMRKSGREVNTAFQSRDIDVETHMSRNSETNRIRALSEKEVEQLIGKARSCMEIAEATHSKILTESAKCSATITKSASMLMGNHYSSTSRFSKPLEEVEELQEDIFDEKDDEPNVVEYAAIEDQRTPKPKWVEIEEQPLRSPRIIEEVKTEIAKPTAKPNTSANASRHGLIDKPMVAQFELYSTSQTLKPSDHALMPLTNTTSYTNPSSYYMEDSDLEYEMLGRAEYTKYCQHRPKGEDVINVGGGFPEFIEMEPRIPCMDLSFLKNASPLRYTDMTDDTQDEERMDNTQMKVVIKSNKILSQQVVTDKSVDKRLEKFDKIEKLERHDRMDKYEKVCKHEKHEKSGERTYRKPKTSTSDKISTPTTPRCKCSQLKDGTHSPERNSPKSIAQRARGKTHIHQHSSASDRSRSKLKTLAISKSIEELKVEKIALFTKMASMQERIIENLDKLKLNLLEIYVPENTYEKSRRQKNAFEFSVRFSRNFLYPLKGMIEHLKITTVESLNSASSNEACGRVASIYALINQSLQTYHKQLRYFLLDQVPQKLTTLIEMIFAATNVCLDKKLFSRNDHVVERLQDRCTKFLSFLEDMHEERFLTARENYRRLNFVKSHSNYDLKMFMNDLNMYEPKLVPRNKHNYRRHRKVVKKETKKSPKFKVSSTPSDMEIGPRVDDAIPTHIQSVEVIGSSFGEGTLSSMHTISAGELLKERKVVDHETVKETTKEAAKEAAINKAILEALQTVTKEQVRQVLEPIIHSLGNALEKRDVNLDHMHLTE